MDESEQYAPRWRRDAVSPSDSAAQLAVVVLELDFCVLDRAGTRPPLNDTSQMDETGSLGSGLARPVRHASFSSDPGGRRGQTSVPAFLAERQRAR